MEEHKSYQFGKLVEKLRRGKQLSQDELAFRCGVTRKTISNIESGKQIPNTQTLLSIPLALGKKTWEFLEMVGDQEMLDELLPDGRPSPEGIKKKPKKGKA